MKKPKNMKKTKSIFFILAAALTLSCSNDDGGARKENPLDAFLVNSGFNQNVTNTLNTSNFVTGFRFSPTANGKISAITLKIPEGDELVKVNIWKVDGAVLMHSENMVIPSANVTVTKTFPAINVNADQDYVICMHTNDAYTHSRNGSTAATYPVTAGNIIIKQYLVDPDFGGDFIPTAGGVSTFNGDLSFIYQKK